jgi:hypothetical protein
MASDTVSVRSRRALLTTAVGGVALAAADSLARPGRVTADTGGSVILGQPNTANAETKVSHTVSGGTAISGYALGLGNGIYGYAPGGAGVTGQGDGGVGVYALNNSTTSAALLANGAADSTAVLGYSGLSAPPPVLAKTGVYGYAVQDANSTGVTGKSTTGRGVNGVATSGTGVFGTGDAGEGVRGVSTGSNGTAGTTASAVASGVYGENTGGGFGTYGRSNASSSGVGIFGESTSGRGVVANSSLGTAFEAQGRVKFSTSGLTSVAVGTKTKIITPGIPISATTLVLCTLESNQGGLSIQRVTKNTTAGSFTVFLPKVVAVGKTAKIAWFLIG